MTFLDTSDQLIPVCLFVVVEGRVSFYITCIKLIGFNLVSLTLYSVVIIEIKRQAKIRQAEIVLNDTFVS